MTQPLMPLPEYIRKLGRYKRGEISLDKIADQLSNDVDLSDYPELLEDTNDYIKARRFLIDRINHLLTL